MSPGAFFFAPALLAPALQRRALQRSWLQRSWLQRSSAPGSSAPALQRSSAPALPQRGLRLHAARSAGCTLPHLLTFLRVIDKLVVGIVLYRSVTPADFATRRFSQCRRAARRC